MRAQLVHPRGHLLALAPLALDRRERRLERVGRRLAVAPLAALVEVHRRGRERDGDGRRLGRRGRAAVVLAREVGEAELVVRRHLPQEVRVELARERLRLGLQRGRRRVGEAQQHRRRLDLQALA